MIAIGGLVGLNIGNKDVTGEVVGGIIENSITNVNVRNNYTLIAGGAVGRMVGGSLNSVISTGSVRAKNIIGGLVGTVNDRISVVHTSTNNYGFIHSNPQLLILPETDGKADQSYFKQCIAATNWIMEEYGYLDSITRLVAGFIGLETFSTYESTSGIYYSDFGTYENQRSFFANTLFKTFEKDYEFDAVILDDSHIPDQEGLTIAERLERFIYLNQEADVKAKYVAGEQVL